MRALYRFIFQAGILCISAVLVLAQGRPPARVGVAPVIEREIAPTTQMIGAIEFERQSGLSSEISGLIRYQKIEEGRIVKKGAVLVHLNTDFLLKDLGILKKQVEQLEIKIQNARKNFKRLQSLYKESATSEKAYDDQADALEQLLKEKEIILENIERRKLELSKSKIRAPFNGMVLEKMKDQGEWVSPGTAVCTLASIDDVVANVAVPESLIRYVQKDQKISIVITALEKALTGIVRTIVPVADPASKTFQMKIKIPYHDHYIQNMSVMAHIPVGRKRSFRMIRRDALVRNQGKEFVYTVKDNKAKILPVTVSAYDGEFVGINEPYLVPGMLIVIDGNERLRPGQPVQIVQPK